MESETQKCNGAWFSGSHAFKCDHVVPHLHAFKHRGKWYCDTCMPQMLRDTRGGYSEEE